MSIQLLFPFAGSIEAYNAQSSGRDRRDRVWKGSVRGPITFAPFNRKARIKIYDRARMLERRTRASVRGRQTSGAIGRSGLAVLHALIFDFLNCATGELDPSYDTIAEAACVSRATVYRALKALKEAGIITWLRRCSGEMVAGVYRLIQETNAYAILPETQWRSAPPPCPPPEPDTWGRTSPLPGGLQDAHRLISTGKSKEAQQALEADPGDSLAAALARLGRARAEKSE